MYDLHRGLPLKVIWTLLLGIALIADAGLQPPSGSVPERLSPNPSCLMRNSCFAVEDDPPDVGEDAEINLLTLPDREESGAREIHSLPPVPNSVSLCLFAFGSLGALRACRSMAKMSPAASVPEWFHSGSICQIGHKTALDLSLDLPFAHQFASAETPSIDLPGEISTGMTPYHDALAHILVPRGPPVFFLGLSSTVGF